MPVLSPEAKSLIRDAVDAETLLNSLGFQINRRTGKEVRAACAIHGGDNPTGFSMLVDSKRWRCFTKKCELDTNGRADNDLFSLVQRCLGFNFIEAVKYLVEMSGLGIDLDTLFVEDNEDFRRKKDVSDFTRTISRLSSRADELPPISENIINGYVQQRDDYFLRFGFDSSTLDFFEVGSMVDRWGVPRATVPVRDASGKLVGISARRTDGDEEPRYLLDFEFQKGKILYNMHNVLQLGVDSVIVVEGFKAAWSVYEAGFPHVVAVMGSVVTDEQAFFLCSLPFRNIILMLDDDEAGIVGVKHSVIKLAPHFNIAQGLLPLDPVPGIVPREELREILMLHQDSL